MRFTHRWQWGALGSLVLLALWFRPDLPPAYGQGVGIYSRSDCTTITSPVAGQTWCFDQTARTLRVYTGSAWATVTLGNATPQTMIVGTSTETVNNYVVYVATGTLQQLGLFLDMVGSNTESNVGQFRIPLVVRAQTGGGVNADGLDALNIIVQQNAADDVAYLNGIELAFNNLKRNDPLNPTDRNHYGLTVDAYGGFSTGPAAMAIRSGAANSNWQRGLWVATNSVTTGGYALDYGGNGFGAVAITASGSIVSGSATGGDKGAGTINIASATFMNGLASQVASPTGINLQNIRGISASSNIPNNLRGTCTFAGAATCAVTFANNERDANYFVLVGGVVDVVSKATTGFTMRATGTTSNAVDWMLIR